MAAVGYVFCFLDVHRLRRLILLRLHLRAGSFFFARNATGFPFARGRWARVCGMIAARGGRCISAQRSIREALVRVSGVVGPEGSCVFGCLLPIGGRNT
jgi:hypothetical protein